MTNKEYTSLNLIEGSSSIRQGSHFTLTYRPRNSKGAGVDLSNKNIDVVIADGNRGIVYETTGTYDASTGLLSYTVDKNIGYGEMWFEVTVTDPNDASYRLKFPTKEYEGRLNIIQGTDDLGKVGVRSITVSQLRQEQQTAQQQFEGAIVPQVENIDAQLKALVVEGDSSPQATQASVGADGTTYGGNLKARLDAEYNQTAVKLADTEAKKADRTELQNLQNQTNNLVLNAAGDGSNPEVLQARGSHWTLNDRGNEHEDYVLKANKNLYGDIKGILHRGFYGRYDGIRIIGKDGQNGTNWYNYYIIDGANKTFYLEYPQPISVRIVEFTAAGAYLSSKVVSNGAYTVSASCGQHVLNLQLENAVPAVADLTKFPSVKSMRNMVVSANDPGTVKKIANLEQTIRDNVTHVEVTTDKTEIAIDIMEGNHNGGFSDASTGWHTFYKEKIPETDRYMVEHPVTGRLRLEQYSDLNYTMAEPRSIVYSNEFFTLRPDCVAFAMNFVHDDTAPNTDWEIMNKEDVKLYGDFPSVTESTLLAELQAIKSNLGIVTPSVEVVKILFIGNSFSEDAVEYVSEMAERVEVPIVIGQMFIASASLEQHWNNANSNANVYSFDKWKSGVKTTTANVSIQTAVSNEDWDFITFQQTSAYSGDYRTFQPYLNDLIAYVRARATNPDMEVGLHMTWAYATNSTHVGFANYGNDQVTMYNAIVSTYQQAMRECNLGLLIPNGTAIQNARTNSHLNSAGNELTRDGYHLDLGTGRFIAGLTAFEIVIARKFKKDLFADMTYAPAANGVTFFHAMLSKTAVKNATLNPFRITEI